MLPSLLTGLKPINGPCSRLFHNGTIQPYVFFPGCFFLLVLNILSHWQVQKRNCILREGSVKATSLCHWTKPMLYSEEQLSKTVEYLVYSSVWISVAVTEVRMLSLDLAKTAFKQAERWRLTTEFHCVHDCSDTHTVSHFLIIGQIWNGFQKVLLKKKLTSKKPNLPVGVHFVSPTTEAQFCLGDRVFSSLAPIMRLQPATTSWQFKDTNFNVGWYLLAFILDWLKLMIAFKSFWRNLPVAEIVSLSDASLGIKIK